MSQTFLLGLELMLYGLVGVFSTLIVFMIAIVLLRKLFPYQEKDQENLQ